MAPLHSRIRLSPRRMIRLASFMLATVSSVLPAAVMASPVKVLTRFPSVGRDSIAFVAYGDLWTVPKGGGKAVRLTDDPGQVLSPHFSPDGASIAFSWRREGGTDVYVIPARGGSPVRLTHGPSLADYDNIVTGWTPDGAKVLFLSQRQTPFKLHYETYEVSVSGGLAIPLGLDHSGLSSLSPDGQRIAFDRTFRNLGRDRWKHYVGGQAPDIYVQDLKGSKLERLTDWEGIDTAPMWVGQRIYFLSDHGVDHRANIWVRDLQTNVTRQITHFRDYDVDMPSVGPGGIGFQNGGGMYVLDTASEAMRRVEVSLPEDPKLARHTVAAAPYIIHNDIAGLPDYALGADHRVAYLAARGDLMALDANGAAKNLTNSTKVMEDHPVASPDGQSLAFVTDAGGEQQLAVMPVAGGRSARTLTRFKSGVLYAPLWSPDGSRLLVADANKRLWLVGQHDGKSEQIAFDPFEEIHDATFSPDGAWIAYSVTRENQTHAIHLRNLTTGTDTVLSGAMDSDHDPAFSADGRRLFFISPRREQPFVSDRDREGTIATIKSDGLFEVELPMEIASADLAAATSRATPVALDLKGGIAALQVRGATLFYLGTAANAIDGDLPGETSGLHAFDTTTGKDRILAPDVDSYVLSPDGKAVLLKRNGKWQIVATAPGTLPDVTLDTRAARMTVDPRAENSAMFDQAWRLDRDLFWDPKMNGVDWPAIRKRYARLAPMIGSHEDLLYLLGEMQGELSTSHMFLGGGDSGDPRPGETTALLGVDFVLDASSGRYRLGHIFRGDNSRTRFAAPLGNSKLDVSDGDYLLAVDGHPLSAPDDPYRLLLDKPGHVDLTLAKALNGPTHVVRVETISSESEIRKLDWIERNRMMVDRLSAGRAGYVYLSDFEETGGEDFIRQFYPQADKPQLVIDVRDNAGGFTSQWVLDVLRRPLAGRFRNREGGVTKLPGAVAPRAMSVVTNIFSRSDGDQFPFFFRQWKMGTVVGQRTWGGVRGIKGPWRLMDGTYITIPKDSLFAVDGAGIIENHGAEPDVVVDDTPADFRSGRSPQLESAVDAVGRP